MKTSDSQLNLLEGSIKSMPVQTIVEKVKNNIRLSNQDALVLYHTDINLLGVRANVVRERKNADHVYFNRNFHIEPTNVCIFSCNFCSYSRQYKNREEGWELSYDEMLDKVKSYDGHPITEVHIVGGVHPKMDIYYFARLLKAIKEHRPDLHIKAFTAVELDYMIKRAKMTYSEGLGYLKENGLNSIPGGGAEIFATEIRAKICADKCTADEWLEIHETAHRLSMASNATMLYGHIETYEHRIQHMSLLRDLQDKTGGFNTFIPLKFRNKDNDMSHIEEVSMIEDLKNYAVSRLFLDNFNHVKAYWPMIGRQTTQLALSYGVDDIDGTIDDSTKIYSMAGSEEQSPAMTTSQLVDLIKNAGRVPIERDTLYNVVKNWN
ncbi:MAG: aminofutalosine synthase MqnE [Bacteroidetes bacterium]|nr:aminofutalosine synthase MqnE [Bacteroidota bacterium]